MELDGSRRGPFCRARALLQGVKRARCPCPGAGGRRRCRTHAGALLTASRPSACRATASGVRLPRPLGSYGTAASGGRSHGRMALHPCCLSAAARSVGPAKSRGPAAAQAGVRWTRLTRRRPSPAAAALVARRARAAADAEEQGSPEASSYQASSAGGRGRPPARRAYPRATLRGCRAPEAEEVVAVAVEVARG